MYSSSLPSSFFKVNNRTNTKFDDETGKYKITNSGGGLISNRVRKLGFSQYHHKILCYILPLDEAVASRAVFVIEPWSDGQKGVRADGRKRFWSQLNKSKTVTGIPYL